MKLKVKKINWWYSRHEIGSPRHVVEEYEHEYEVKLNEKYMDDVLRVKNIADGQITTKTIEELTFTITEVNDGSISIHSYQEWPVRKGYDFSYSNDFIVTIEEPLWLAGRSYDAGSKYLLTLSK